MVFFIKKSLDRNNKSPEIGEITNDDNTTTNCVFSNESHPVMTTQSVILGAKSINLILLFFKHNCFMNVLTDDATEFNAWMCVPFTLLGSMLHTPMFAFGYLCFTFSTQQSKIPKPF
jgi:hypothetical protein